VVLLVDNRFGVQVRRFQPAPAFGTGVPGQALGWFIAVSRPIVVMFGYLGVLAFRHV
jgi:hypothetical protein